MPHSRAARTRAPGALKATEHGAKVVTLSDSDGFLHEPGGFTAEVIEEIIDLKQDGERRIREAGDGRGTIE